MSVKKEAIKKTEIKNRLRLAQDLVRQVIIATELNCDWKDIHAIINKANIQLRLATNLLAYNHLDVCVAGKRKKRNTPIAYEDIEQIMKTYRYLN